jgi:beta-phosphoglucomutase-like phosphatase (HAD superfamily)
VAAQEAIAIEDSRNGLLAAKCAGLRCVVVPNAITRHCTFEEADLQVASLAEVNWQQVCGVF